MFKSFLVAKLLLVKSVRFENSSEWAGSSNSSDVHSTTSAVVAGLGDVIVGSMTVHFHVPLSRANLKLNGIHFVG